MGEVYKARDTRLDRTVAIKVLPAQVAADPRFRERFEREAKAISQLSHPHICMLHDVGRQDGIDYLVMEYLEGQTLAQRLYKGALPLDQALRYAVQIAEALDRAHRQGIVHRDLKPGNIMLTKSGAKLLDFGLAKASGQAITGSSPSMLPSTVPMTAEGAILGTLQYMAPEQLEGKEADSRSDIFSFGAIIFEMTTGKRAFEGNSAATVIAAIVDRQLPPMSTLQPLTPPMLDRIANKCLAKNPDDRWQTAHDLSDELKWIAEHESHAIAGTFQRRPVARRLTYLAVGAALIGVVTVLAWRTFDRPPPDPPVVRMPLAPPDRTEEFGRSAAVSPNGRWLTFIASTGGRQMLWVHALNALDSQALAGTEDASYPFWSPDSTHIGFFAGGKLKTVDAKGSPPVTLADAYNGRGGTWAADGTIIYAPGFIDPLHRVDASGRDPKPLTTLDRERGEDGHQWPWFLPDGRHFVFLVKSFGPEHSGIYVGSLDSGERVRLMDASLTNVQYAKPGYLLFLRGQTLMAQAFDARALTLTGSPSRLVEGVRYSAATQHGFFAASDTGTLVYALGGSPDNRLVWVDRDGKLIRQVTESQRQHGHLTLSPDGQHIAVPVSGDNSVHIWVNRVPDTDVTPFTFGDVYDPQAVWSPTGAELLWARGGRPGEFGFYRKRFSGSESEQRVWRAPAGTTDTLDNQPTDWSPDGTHLLVQSRRKDTKWDLWLLPLSGDQKAQELIHTPSNEGQGQFSPDGRWVAYTSDESRGLQVYVQPYPLTGRKWQVSVAGGMQPAWRRDGKELFFLEPGSTRMMAVDVVTDKEDFGSEKPHLLFQLPTIASTHASEPGSHYGVRPDGQRFLVSVNDETPVQSLNVIVNWSSDLPR